MSATFFNAGGIRIGRDWGVIYVTIDGMDGHTEMTPEAAFNLAHGLLSAAGDPSAWSDKQA